MNITQHDGSRVCSNIKDNARFVTFKRLVHAIFKGVGLQKTQQFNILCSVFEDNVGALSLETLDLPQMTPRFKHYAVKYHCFRACLNQKYKSFESRIETTIGRDIHNGLPKSTFENIKELFMGW